MGCCGSKSDTGAGLGAEASAEDIIAEEETIEKLRKEFDPTKFNDIFNARRKRNPMSVHSNCEFYNPTEIAYKQAALKVQQMLS